MGEYYCNLCDRTFKLKYKEKHLYAKSHMGFSESIINEYCVENPKLIELEEIKKKHVKNYDRRFEFYHIIRKRKLQFVDTVICVKFKKLYSDNTNWGLASFFMKKIENFGRQGLRFSYMLEMNITSITRLDLMTYEHYIIQPMQMVERVLNQKLIGNPELVKLLYNVHFTLHMGRKQITLEEE